MERPDGRETRRGRPFSFELGGLSGYDGDLRFDKREVPSACRARSVSLGRWFTAPGDAVKSDVRLIVGCTGEDI